MLRIQRLRAAGALVAAAATAPLPALAATITINVGASPSIANALVDLIGTFQAYYFDQGVSYNIAVTVDTNANLKAAALGGATPALDLILTDDTALGADLAANSSAYLQGLPLSFATDRLDLYSTTVNVSRGLPANFTGPLVVADPSADVYGAAAAAAVAQPPWRVSAIPSSRVAVQPNVATVQVAVELGLYPYGAVPKSAICTNPAGTEVYPAGSTHAQFEINNPAYRVITLQAVALANAARTADQGTELTRFTDFLTGVGTTLGTDVLGRFCYGLPKKC